MSDLRIAGTVGESITDGPGFRFTVFTQGCPHHCEGCHNPQTHPFKGGKKVNIKKIIKEIDANPLLYGVTFSGGEPFIQAKALIPLAKHIKEKGLELACYTGFLFEYLNSCQLPYAKELLNYIDILIDGKFIISQKSLDCKFKGSRNQRTIDVQNSLLKNCAVISKNPKWI